MTKGKIEAKDYAGQDPGPGGSLVPNVCVRTKSVDIKCEDPISLETWAFFVTRPANNPLFFMLSFDPIETSWEGLEGIAHFKV